MRWFVVVALVCVCSVVLAQQKPADKPAERKGWEAVTEKEINAITYEDAEVDTGFVTPLAADLNHLDEETTKRLNELEDKLAEWGPGQEKDIGQRVRNWMSLATLPDLGRAEFEAELPYVIFERLKTDVPEERLKKALAWVILNPKEGKVVVDAKELGIEGPVDEGPVRQRATIYAKKLLGRLLGKLPPKES